MTATADCQYTSIGILATRIGRDVDAIEAVADVLQIQPAMQINGTKYFSGPQVDRLTAQLRKETR